MKVAIYARVSTRDKDQNPETQLLALRQAAEVLGYEIVATYVDRAAAQDLRNRALWRQLLQDAGKRRFQAVVVFKLDRAFRSVKDMHDTLAAWQVAGVEFKSVRESFDTTTAIGRLMLNMLASMAEFELELIRERVLAGMDRVRAQGTKSGKPIGRPRVKVDIDALARAYRATESVAKAAEIVKCNRTTARRHLEAAGVISRNGGATE